MRKTFPCGHVGKGQYCHVCALRDKLMAERVAVRVEKLDRIALAESVLGISCAGLPEPVVSHAAEIVGSIRDGSGYQDYRGKRLVYHNRDVVSIPVGYSYRLLCRDGAGLEVMGLMSHEEYNKQWRGV